MKIFIALFLTLGLNLSTFAGNEGPQAIPKQPGMLVAESVVGIPFGPPSYPKSIRYQIYSSGYTQVVKKTSDGKADTITALKPFSTEEMRAMISDIKEIVPGPLFDPNPSMPGCMDGPSQVYKVYPSTKSEIDISSRFACKTNSRKNANQADADLIKILDDLSRS
jgi:hypothetical protein